MLNQARLRLQLFPMDLKLLQRPRRYVHVYSIMCVDVFNDNATVKINDVFDLFD
jgi:hypothetical protein